MNSPIDTGLKSGILPFEGLILISIWKVGKKEDRNGIFAGLSGIDKERIMNHGKDMKIRESRIANRELEFCFFKKCGILKIEKGKQYLVPLIYLGLIPEPSHLLL